MKIVRRPSTSETRNRIACSWKHCHNNCLYPCLANVYTVNRHGDSHAIMNLVLAEKWMALHIAVDGSLVYLHGYRSQINDRYQIRTRMFEIFILLSLRVDSMIWQLCISHVCCLIFALYTNILLIFSFNRMQTRNSKLSMTQRWQRCAGLIIAQRRASFNATRNWGIPCGPWRLVLHSYISLLYYWVLLFFYVLQDHLNENSLSN